MRSMKNCPGIPGSTSPAAQPDERVRPDGLDADDAKPGGRHVSWRERVSPRVARAIASTAAVAPAIVVTQGTRATRAASRIR